MAERVLFTFLLFRLFELCTRIYIYFLRCVSCDKCRFSRGTLWVLLAVIHILFIFHFSLFCCCCCCSTLLFIALHTIRGGGAARDEGIGCKKNCLPCCATRVLHMCAHTVRKRDMGIWRFCMLFEASFGTAWPSFYKFIYNKITYCFVYGVHNATYTQPYIARVCGQMARHNCTYCICVVELNT